MAKTVLLHRKMDSKYQKLNRIVYLRTVFKTQIVLCIVSFIGKVLIEDNSSINGLPEPMNSLMDAAFLLHLQFYL